MCPTLIQRFLLSANVFYILTTQHIEMACGINVKKEQDSKFKRVQGSIALGIVEAVNVSYWKVLPLQNELYKKLRTLEKVH